MPCQMFKAVGRPKPGWVVATACMANTLATAIPCQRVVRGDGALGGYRQGLARKEALPAYEPEAGQVVSSASRSADFVG